METGRDRNTTKDSLPAAASRPWSTCRIAADQVVVDPRLKTVFVFRTVPMPVCRNMQHRGKIRLPKEQVKYVG